ncbi:MFS transporter [Hydrogenivirga caldilitoris]|uniref:MFS transporter n=1 Tax=Hydrogenivirga caldilitoris TaxID=246264 RepID=UPI00237B6B13|nr:MFS transporter [Hydrogenivirga caldilitoris]
MNLPVIVLLIPVAYFFLPDIGERKPVPFNLLSYTLLSVSSVSFIVFLSKGESWGWFYSDKTFYVFYIALLTFLLFMVSELISERKLIDYSIFKEPNYLYAFITFVLVYGFVFFQTIYLIPIYFERLRDVPTFQTGLQFVGFAFFLALFALVGGRLSDRMEPKLLLLVSQSTLFIALFFFLSHLDYETPKAKIFLYLCLLGFAMGFFFSPLTALAFKSLKPLQIPIGSAVYNYARLMGASFATSIATYQFETGRAFHYDEINALRAFLSGQDIADFSLKFKLMLARLQNTLAGIYAVQDALKIASYISLLSIMLTLFFLFLTSRRAGIPSHIK